MGTRVRAKKFPESASSISSGKRMVPRYGDYAEPLLQLGIAFGVGVECIAGRATGGEFQPVFGLAGQVAENAKKQDVYLHSAAIVTGWSFGLRGQGRG